MGLVIGERLRVGGQITNHLFPSIEVPNELVSPKVLPDGNLSSFPYHYSCETSNYVSQQIQSILNKNMPTL